MIFDSHVDIQDLNSETPLIPSDEELRGDNVGRYMYFKNISRNALRLGSALTFTPSGGAVVNSLTREIAPAILKATKVERPQQWTHYRFQRGSRTKAFYYRRRDRESSGDIDVEVHNVRGDGG